MMSGRDLDRAHIRRGSGPLHRGSEPPLILQIGMWWQTANAGGLDRVYQNLVQQLPKTGVRVLGLVQGPSNVGQLTGGKVLSFAAEGTLMPQRYLDARRTISALLRDNNFNLVASHFALYTALVLDKLRHLPVVTHFHGPWAHETAEEGGSRYIVAVKRRLEKRVYRRSDRIIVTSHAFAKLVAGEYGVPEDRVRVVPGSVDIKRFAISESRAEARRLLGWPEGRPTLLAVRRLTNRMGLDRLILAMIAVLKRVPDALLCIVGKGHLGQALERQARAVGLDENHVRFLGFMPEEYLPFAFRAADINVVPTLALEGFGLVAAEALAAGTVSMVTPVGGLAEVVSPLSADLIFRSIAPSEIAEGLIAALRGRLQLPDEQNCRDYAARKFSASLAAKRAAEVYSELMG